MAKLYRKKPVEVYAVQWTGTNKAEIQEFCGNVAHFYVFTERGKPIDSLYNLYIDTLEGNHYANIGDYIIRGVANEFYSCKPDIFKKTYEEVVDG